MAICKLPLYQTKVAMSIVLIFENKDVEPWAKVLTTRLPNTIVEIYPKVKNLATVDFVVCWKPKKNVLQQFPNAKVIQSVGASIDHITNSQILKKNLRICRIIDSQLSQDMWEFLLSAVMNQLKNIKTYATQQQDGIWKQLNYKTINNTTISILGLGNIGGFVARKFASIGFHVKGWSNSEKQISNVSSFYGNNQLDSFLNNSDFLINLLPLTDKTKGILNKTTFQKLPKSSFLINVGRGEHVVETDLIESLNSSKLSGALLDVFAVEPLPKTHAFWSHPKILITPHVASLTNVESASEQIVDNYNRFINNKKLLHTVSLEKGY